MVKREGTKFGIATNNTLKYNSIIDAKQKLETGEIYLYLKNKDNQDLSETIRYSLNKHNRWELLDHPLAKYDNNDFHNNNNEINKSERKEMNKLNKKIEFEKQLIKNKYQKRQIKKEEQEELNKKKEIIDSHVDKEREQKEEEVKIKVKKQKEPYECTFYSYNYGKDRMDDDKEEGSIEIHVRPSKNEIYKKNQLRDGEIDFDYHYNKKGNRNLKKENFKKDIFI